MPYIQREERVKLRPLLDEFQKHAGDINAGKFNYLITRMICLIAARRGTSYDLINQLIGVLECVKLEFYRRGAAVYEKKKMQDNGDVYMADDLKEAPNEGQKSPSGQ
jgi:hypothetical protein